MSKCHCTGSRGVWLVVALLSATPMVAASTAQAQGVQVRIAPPAARVEVRTRAPSPRHVWLAGHWRWDGHKYAWVGGRWALPPRAGVAWQAPRWTQRAGGWAFVPGRWGASARVQVAAPPVAMQRAVAHPTIRVQVAAPPPPTVAVRIATPAPPPPPMVAAPAVNGIIEVQLAPPALKVERRAPRPSPGHVWVHGYWRWDGQHYGWVGGRWEMPQRAGARWVAPRWKRHGRRWVFVPGRWAGGHVEAHVVARPVVARPEEHHDRDEHVHERNRGHHRGHDRDGDHDDDHDHGHGHGHGHGHHHHD